MRIWDMDADCICGNEIEIIDLDTGQTLEVIVGSQSRIAKAGILQPDDFSGTPQLATVTFVNPYPDATYVIALSGVDSRLFSYQSKTAQGFVVNANSYDALTGEVSWTTTISGETS